MQRPPYSGPEVGASRRLLDELVPRLPEPALLLGGWAVYLIVRENWSRAKGQDYFGSRDIDLGFHTSADLPDARIRSGNLPATLSCLEGEGFVRNGMWGMCRFAAYSDGRTLTEDETKMMPLHDFYRISVDLIVSARRPDLRQMVGFDPVEEPALEHAFRSESNRLELRLGRTKVLVTAPHLLVVTKLRSLPGRGEDHKAIKDLSDLYAVVGFSGVPAYELARKAARLDPEIPRLGTEAMSHPLLDRAAAGLGIPPPTLRAAIGVIAAEE
ncbi:MAG TPA: hypothetical protein VI893_03595 [Thermoplasmata archaeon]|nr:hypothetical protein [Thermoplasmata archaeon]